MKRTDIGRTKQGVSSSINCRAEAGEGQAGLAARQLLAESIEGPGASFEMATAATGASSGTNKGGKKGKGKGKGEGKGKQARLCVCVCVSRAQTP